MSGRSSATIQRTRVEMTSSASTMWPTHSSTDHSVGSGRDAQEVFGLGDQLTQRGRAR